MQIKNESIAMLIPRLNPKALDRIDHAGLLLKRFVPQKATSKNKYSEYSNKESNKEAEKNFEWLFERAQKAMKNVHPFYKEAFQRRTDTLPEHTKSFIASVPPHSRLIVGLGTASVLETGLTLHHTYGTPIIPGSALKGLCAHHAQEVFFEPDAKNIKKPCAKTEYFTYDQYRFLFGDSDQTGCLVFHDAWIYPKNLEENLEETLCRDIITPHHQEYYSSQGTHPPTDFDCPVPVSFLSVRGKFQVLLTCDGVSSEECQQWLVLIEHLLSNALENCGIGGKTSSGYGRMKLESCQ